MNKTKQTPWLLLLLPLFILSASAVDAAAATDLNPIDAVSFLLNLLPPKVQMALVSYFAIVGVLRHAGKLWTTLYHGYCAFARKKPDEEFLARAENSPAWKAALFWIDLLLSWKPYRGPADPAAANAIPNIPTAPPPPAPSGPAAFTKLAGLFALSTILFTMSGCARLEKGGAYAPATPVIANGQTNLVATSAPDMEFFLVDQSFNLLQAAADAAFETERQNRAFLWSVSRDIKHTLDRYRPLAKQAVKDYANARRGYLANPTPAGLSTLQTVTDKLHQISDAVTAALPKQNK